jgi:hypothetical protein
MQRKTAIALTVLAALAFTSRTAVATQGNSANAKLCQHDGWETLMDSTATPFANQDECVSTGAHRGAIYALGAITVELCEDQPLDGICVNTMGSGLEPGSAMITTIYKNDSFVKFSSINAGADGTATDSTGSFEACVEGNLWSANASGTSADSLSEPVMPGIPITSNTVMRTSNCP